MKRKETLALLERHHIRPNRLLGQNFLVDERIAAGICETAGLGKSDLIIEIGPGAGSLTAMLAERAGRVVALEIDRNVLPALHEVLAGAENCTVINADALKTDFGALAAGWSGPVKVVANLPYYITTPLIVKLLVELPGCSGLVLMVQKEAAARIMAGPNSKQYGPMAILITCFGQASRALNAPADAFFPRPGVDSCVIRICPAARLPLVADWPAFRDFLECCFAQRRRTLANSLRIAGLPPARLASLPMILSDLGLAANIRADALTGIQFAKIFNHLHKEIDFMARSSLSCR